MYIFYSGVQKNGGRITDAAQTANYITRRHLDLMMA